MEPVSPQQHDGWMDWWMNVWMDWRDEWIEWMYINNKIQSPRTKFLNGHPIFNLVLTMRIDWCHYMWKLKWDLTSGSHMNENWFHFFFIWENPIGTLKEPTSNSQSHVPHYDFLNNNHQLGRWKCCLRFGLGTNYNKKLNPLFFCQVCCLFFFQMFYVLFFLFFLCCFSSSFCIGVVILLLLVLFFSHHVIVFFVLVLLFFFVLVFFSHWCYSSHMGVALLFLVLIWYFPLLPCVDGSLEH